MTDPILIAKNASHELVLLPQLANRHGLITGATGTGKTVTLQTLAQGLSKIGVPVFLADVKGDLTGISQPGQPNDKLKARLEERGLPEPQCLMLDEAGRPEVTERAFVVPPASRIGPISNDERRALMANSLVAGHYDTPIDRESAYEKLTGRVVATPAAPVPGSIGTDFGASSGTAPTPAPAPAQAGNGGGIGGWLDAAGSILTSGTGRSGRGDSIVEALAKSAARSIGSQVGREIVRGVLGSLLGGAKRR